MHVLISKVNRTLLHILRKLKKSNDSDLHLMTNSEKVFFNKTVFGKSNDGDLHLIIG